MWREFSESPILREAVTSVERRISPRQPCRAGPGEIGILSGLSLSSDLLTLHRLDQLEPGREPRDVVHEVSLPE